MEISNFFVGHSDIDTMLSVLRMDIQIGADAPLYVFAAGMNVAGNNAHGIGLTRAWLTVAAIKDGVCHYCRAPYGQYQTIHGEPFGDPARVEEIRKRGAQVLKLTHEYLAERNFRNVLDALIAMPRDYVYLDGDFGFLTWDAEGKQFRRLTNDELRRAAAEQAVR